MRTAHCALRDDGAMSLTQPTLATPVAANLYPATVRDPSGAVAYQKVRVVLTPEWLVIYAERNEGGTRRSVFTAQKVAHTGLRPGKRSGGWEIDTEDGTWTVDRGSGCGCGSPLRHMPSPAPLDL